MMTNTNIKSFFDSTGFLNTNLLTTVLLVFHVATATAANEAATIAPGTTPVTPATVKTAVVKGPSRVVDSQLIDKTVSPCDDFFQYSCGVWLKKTAIPKDRSSVYRFSEIDINTEKVLKGILEKYKAGKYIPAQKYATKMGDFYKSCTTETAANRYARKEVAKLLAQIDQLPAKESKSYFHEISKLVSEFHQSGIPVFFGFYVDQDPGDARQVIPQIDQGGLGLPERGYYLEDNKEKNKTRAEYLKHVEKVLNISGGSSLNGGAKGSQAQSDLAAAVASSVKNIYAVEENMAKASLSPIERRDPKAVYHRMPLKDLQTLAPRFEWNTYFSMVGVTEGVELNVAVPDFFKEFSQILENRSRDEIVDYLKWYTLHSVANFSYKELIKENFNFYGKFLNGQKAMKPRWKTCVASIDTHLGEALGDAFVELQFGPEAKNMGTKMMVQIQAVVREMFDQLDWMDQPTRVGAVKKLGTLMKKVGYPEPSRNYDSYHVNPHSWFENVLEGNRFDTRRMVAKIGKPIDRGEWGMTASTNNAYYNPLLNEIVFPAGILQEPLFSVNADLAANYGATGATIGHEITHGFDDEGRQFDENGNLKDWWSEKSVQRFNEKAQCLSKQYDNYTVADGVHVKGELTLGENIADLGGLKIALNAYKKEAPQTPTTEEYQRFFIAYAQSWCGKATPEYEKNIVQVDPHSPARFRVNGVVVNMPEFSQAFSCKEAQPMNPAQRCQVW